MRLKRVDVYFHRTGMPRYILDLRKAAKSSPASAWLMEEIDFRSIGALAQDQYFPTIVTNDYDGLIFLDQTAPSSLLER